MSYKNFKTAVFCTKYDIDRIENFDDVDAALDELLHSVHIDKLYLESFRTGDFVDESKIKELRQHVEAKGIATSGALTLNVRGNGKFKSFCYSNPEHQQLLVEVVEHAATMFDEVILDDFYFTNCKCDLCIEGKGERSWTEFRTSLLEEASNTIMMTAKKVNPNVHMIIKYPNWYEDYQSTGYHVKEASELFDAIYTGTETRDSIRTQQNLQPYLSYFLMRYMENVKPGHNDGGWFDTYDCGYNPNRYLEQLNLTLFAKAKEATLFCMGNLLGPHDLFVPLAGYGFKKADAIMDKLGEPTGIACYKPYNSKGENYIHNFIGLLGMPLEPKPYYDFHAPEILLTESAVYDDAIVECIHKGLMTGQNVIITSGLLKALQQKPEIAGKKHIFDIAEIKCSDQKALIEGVGFDMGIASFNGYEKLPEPILIPQIVYSTNDAWAEAVGMKGEKSYPLLMSTDYGKGRFMVLTTPEDYSDYYGLTSGVLNHIRYNVNVASELKLYGPSKVSLFTYDNQTFILQSFRDENMTVTIVLKGEDRTMTALDDGKTYKGINRNGDTYIEYKLEPRCYKGFSHA